MTTRLAITIAQFNPHVGDIDGNAARMETMRARASDAGDGAPPDLIVFPELSVLGYPSEDMVLKREVQEACRRALDRLAAVTADHGPSMLVGSPYLQDGALLNAAVLLAHGRIAGVALKKELPNYGPFDEPRVFRAHDKPAPIQFRDLKLGACVCEDIWLPSVGPALKSQGADILIAPHASPYRRGALALRQAAAIERARQTGLPVMVVNQLGGQDELVFDGGAFVVDAEGVVVAQAPSFEEGVFHTLWERDARGLTMREGPKASVAEGVGSDYRAIVLALRDYVRKTDFSGVLVGLSGGLDSALVATLAVDALGAENVRCVRLPSRHSSDHSLKDAETLARTLGVRLDTIPISEPVAGVETALQDVFEGRAPDVTEENVQSRMRGLLLMAMSNKFGLLLLTTGNKSENAVGYATLYGDMCGGFNPIKDVYKTEAYALARHRNAVRPQGCLGPAGAVIPEAILAKAPSAELRPDQKDTDSLPDYDVLDAILHELIEEDRPAADIVKDGHDAALVARVERLVYASEYKRRQSAPGVKISRRMFGKDRRYPIVNAFRSAR